MAAMAELVTEQQDGFVVARGHTGGERAAGKAIRCSLAFSHACFGQDGKFTLRIFTNDVRRSQPLTFAPAIAGGSVTRGRRGARN